jgi:hypothetical protein
MNAHFSALGHRIRRDASGVTLPCRIAAAPTTVSYLRPARSDAECPRKRRCSWPRTSGQVQATELDTAPFPVHRFFELAAFIYEGAKLENG